jgi:hypothetical protein
METGCKCFRVDRRDIAYLRFIFEGYDGIAVVTTLDRDAGIVAVRMAPGCENEVEGVLGALSKEILIEALDADAAPDADAALGQDSVR